MNEISLATAAKPDRRPRASLHPGRAPRQQPVPSDQLPSTHARGHLG